MAIERVVATFVCDGWCGEKFEVRLDLVKTQKSSSLYDIAVGQLGQPDNGEHYCNKCIEIAIEEYG